MQQVISHGSSLSYRRVAILAFFITLTLCMYHYAPYHYAWRALEHTPQGTSGAANVAPSGTALKSNWKSLNLSFHFEPDHVRSTTRDIVVDNGATRIFSPGRLKLRSLSSSVTLDACSVNATELHFILSDIRAFIVANNTTQCLAACKVQLPVPHLICPEALLSFRLPNSLLLPAGAQNLQIPGIEFENGGFSVMIGGSNCKIMSIAASSSDVVVMQAPMTFTFAIMVVGSPSYNFENVRKFVKAIRDLGIPPTFYEILVLGSSMKLPGDDGIDIRYLCDKCLFTDKIREAFAQSSMETVLVAHDYIVVGPDFYEGMRGFGRDWQSVQPGTWISHTGENLSKEPCPTDQYCHSRIMLSSECWTTPYQEAICDSSVCANASYTAARSALEDNVEQRMAVGIARGECGRGTTGYVFLPQGMRVSRAVSRTSYVNGNLYIMKRQLGCCVPVRAGVNHGEGEDLEWANQLGMRADVIYEENPFVSVQLLHEKHFGAVWSTTLATWLLASGNGVYLHPKRLSPQFWCNDTSTCGVV